MASRLDVQTRREALYETLKHACLDGTLAPGVMLPTKRELGDQYGVSANVVLGVIQSLAQEGMLYTVPRVGTFVGRPQQESVEPYLMVLPFHEANREHYLMQTQMGFEDRVAQLGGHSIVLTPEETRLLLQENELPPLSGVFENIESTIHTPDATRLFEGKGMPCALFNTLEEADAEVDCVSFDDVGGGALAAGHLWQNGHRSIAFLALHSEGDPGPLSWSVRREIGWRQAIEQAGGSTIGLNFRPQKTSGFSIEDQVQAASEAAQGLVGRSDITAVIVVNAPAADGLYQTFHEANWPIEKWPAIVCFDTTPGTGNSVVSYLRLPWEEIGREVAQVLWERRRGRLTGPPVQRLVPMRLIPRLSCRPDWATSSSLAKRRFTISDLPTPKALQNGLELMGA